MNLLACYFLRIKLGLVSVEARRSSVTHYFGQFFFSGSMIWLTGLYDFLWQADNLGFTNTAINACPNVVDFVVVRFCVIAA